MFHHPLTWDLVDGLGAVWVADVERVCGVINEDGPVLAGKGHELRQLLAGGSSPRWIVGRAEEDNVSARDLQRGEGIALRGASGRKAFRLS